MSTKVVLESLGADGRKLTELAAGGLARDGISVSEFSALEAVVEDIASRLATLRRLLDDGQRSSPPKPAR